jgi:hypothetical protein
MTATTTYRHDTFIAGDSYAFVSALNILSTTKRRISLTAYNISLGKGNELSDYTYAYTYSDDANPVSTILNSTLYYYGASEDEAYRTYAATPQENWKMTRSLTASGSVSGGISGEANAIKMARTQTFYSVDNRWRGEEIARYAVSFLHEESLPLADKVKDFSVYWYGNDLGYWQANNTLKVRTDTPMKMTTQYRYDANVVGDIANTSDIELYIILSAPLLPFLKT